MYPSARDLFEGDFIFQQDNDPKHRANIVKKYMANKGLNVMEWPSYSPDLNPIENLWSLFGRQMADRKPSNEDELFDILMHGWNQISTDLLRSLVQSMPRRCQAVIDSRGYPRTRQ